MKNQTQLLLLVGLFCLILIIFGCTSVNPPLAKGLLGFQKLDDSQATDKDVELLVLANNKFAIDYYKKIDNGENLFFSPFSITTAVAIAYEGADGKTAEEIRKVFYFNENDLERQSAFAKIYNIFNENASKGNYEFSIANALWKEKTYEFKQEYLETINNYYYGGTNKMDFKNNSEKSRQEINEWVEEQTRNKIKDLLPANPPSITQHTKMVITNAIYFKGDWEKQFEKENTINNEFFITKETKTNSTLMTKTDTYNYFEDEKFQYLEMNYKGGDISMLVILPISEEDYFNFEIPSAEEIILLKNKMNAQEINLQFPKLKLETEYEMVENLQEMGMTQAFSAEANFSKMDSLNQIYISKIYHKAFVSIDEEGTQATAATAIIMDKVTSMPKETIDFITNHPFAFIIKDNKTEEILFLGKITNPSK